MIYDANGQSITDIRLRGLNVLVTQLTSQPLPSEVNVMIYFYTAMSITVLVKLLVYDYERAAKQTFQVLKFEDEKAIYVVESKRLN